MFTVDSYECKEACTISRGGEWRMAMGVGCGLQEQNVNADSNTSSPQDTAAYVLAKCALHGVQAAVACQRKQGAEA